MTQLRLISAVLLSLFLTAGLAHGQTFNNGNSTLSANGGTVVVCPAGDGESLDSAGTPVHLKLIDDLLLEIMWPGDQMGLVAVDGGDFYCPGTHPIRGFPPDSGTNSSGETDFTGMIYGGGYSDAGFNVTLYNTNGTVYWEGIGNPVAIRLVSPDINGDGKVDLQDVGIFAIDFAGEYHWRSDFYDDPQNPNKIDLHEVALLASHYGHICP